MRRTLVTLLALSVLCAAASGQELRIAEPASYEKMVGKDIIQLENEFLSTVCEGSGVECVFDPSEYKKAGGKFYMKAGKAYWMEQIRDDSYAVENGDRLIPLCSASYPEESLRTLLTVPAAAVGFTIHLVHHKYGFVEDTYDVDMGDFLASCMADGCEPFVGVEECTEDMISASLFLVNTEKGYNHVLKVRMSLALLKSRLGCLTADLNTYIPTHNISELYAK